MKLFCYINLEIFVAVAFRYVTPLFHGFTKLPVSVYIAFNDKMHDRKPTVVVFQHLPGEAVESRQKAQSQSHYCVSLPNTNWTPCDYKSAAFSGSACDMT
jgi:hypothetical protein